MEHTVTFIGNFFKEKFVIIISSKEFQQFEVSVKRNWSWISWKPFLYVDITHITEHWPFFFKISIRNSWIFRGGVLKWSSVVSGRNHRWREKSRTDSEILMRWVVNLSRWGIIDPYIWHPMMCKIVRTVNLPIRHPIDVTLQFQGTPHRDILHSLITAYYLLPLRV